MVSRMLAKMSAKCVTKMGINVLKRMVITTETKMLTKMVTNIETKWQPKL